MERIASFPGSMPMQAVVLDWAGTTVDFGCRGPVMAFVEGFACFGVDVSVAEAREPMGKGEREHVAALCSMPRIRALWESVHGRGPAEEDIDAVYAEVEARMLTVISKYSTPIPGAVEAIAALRSQGLRIGSCTGYPRPVAEIVAGRAREYGYEPDVLVCATDVSHSRPAPDMCNEALVLLGVDDPARAVKIGDTVNDVLEGLHAGMWVIGLTLSGSMAGLSEKELKKLLPTEREALHQRISQELLRAGAHYTAADLPACLPLIREMEGHC